VKLADEKFTPTLSKPSMSARDILAERSWSRAALRPRRSARLKSARPKCAPINSAPRRSAPTSTAPAKVAAPELGVLQLLAGELAARAGAAEGDRAVHLAFQRHGGVHGAGRQQKGGKGKSGTQHW
jgi:hypothetical protein